jgi:hypothetical protein
MPNIDIELDADLSSALALPSCDEIGLRMPGSLKIHLPTGGTIQAIADLSKGMPTDCALTFSLMVQIAPLLASMECLLKILKLLKPLISVITDLPKPPSFKTIKEFIDAASGLAPCLAIPTPVALAPFVRDILCLILKVLKCLLSQFKALIAMLQDTQLKLEVARADGNFALEETLLCAQANAEASGRQMTAAIEPIAVLLDLAGPVLEIAGVQPIKLPALGGQTDLTGLITTTKAIQGVVGTLEVVVEGLGGCPS